MIELEIRDASPDDAQGIIDVLNPIIAERLHTVLDTPFTAEAEREFIRAFPARGVFHVAVNRANSELVGFQNVEPFAGYTRAFDHVGVIGTYVRHERRRQGIAGRLFEATAAAARGKGYEKLFTFVREDNPAALQAYLRHGFRVVGIAERHARIDGRYVNEIIIERLLIPESGGRREDVVSRVQGRHEAEG